MKRFLCLLFVLVLFPVVSFGDDPDPIVGCWYMYYDKAFTPEMESAFPGVDKMICVYVFSENGTINLTGTQVIGADGTPEYSVGGKWEKSGSSYMVSLIGYGKCKTLVDNDCLMLEIESAPGYYMVLKKMYPFDPYNDYVRK